MMAQAIVTEIERFALYDGPGIRTTVFLKGCPLHCAWCHNPECIRPGAEMSYQAEKCTGCGACVQACPHGVHALDSQGHRVDFARCTGCGACTQACPNGAVRLLGQSMTAEQVMDTVLRDARYYQASGGGLTISGGEPLASGAFTLALLQLARDKGIHTAVETSCQGATGLLEQLLPYTDLFLVDCKETDPDRHRQYTGADPGLILHNLRFLVSHGAQVVLRCPIIPGYNDREEHYRGIAALLRELPGIRRCECMAYHTMGLPKYRQLGKECHTRPQMLTEEEKTDILGRINQLAPIPVTWG